MGTGPDANISSAEKLVASPSVDRSAEIVLENPHGEHGDRVAAALFVDIQKGLTTEEVRFRSKRDGPNTLSMEKGDAWWTLLLRQFSSIVVWLLLAAAIVSLITDDIAEAVAILVVLLVNAAIGFAIEWRAGRALDALRKTTAATARVRRNGSEKIVDAAELVIGDIISLAAGDRVPADARLIEAINLQTDESALTGESVPVTKTAEPVSIASVLTERRSMAYLATMVVAGRAVAIVTATGSATEVGRVGNLLAKTRSEATPLERRLASLGRMLVYGVLAIAAIVMLAGFLRGDDPALMLRVSISLAVAAVPEALPAMTTLILALGVLRMARQRAIVRKLSAVEALGSTTVICTDKTGTLTENRMTVREYRLSDGQSFELENHGPVSVVLDRLLRTSVLCNDAAFDSGPAKHDTIGDPTETALLVAADLLERNAAAERLRYEKVRECPFDAVSKRMTAVLRDKNTDKYIAVLKGAPSVVLGMCSDFITDDGSLEPLDDEMRASFLSINEDMASSGLRVLAFADRSLETAQEEIERGYTFLGFSGMTDPPRQGVESAIRTAQEAGIRIVMLTGDQVMTAGAIARELNLSPDGDIYSIHASEITAMDDTALAQAAARAHVFARVSPEDKLRIVEALQKAGEIVAVTGDGINDAPALKRSDIGIAMGLRGTEVAKEAADVVLTDDNFATIVKAIEGGRTIYANIIKFVHLMFSHNLGEVLVIFAALVSGLPLPLLPLQILWLNIITDVFPALALAVEPASGETMGQHPRSSGGALFSPQFLFLICWQGLMLSAITLAAYVWALDAYGDGAHARTVALLALVGVELGHSFNCRSRTRSAFNGFFTNPYIFGAAMIMVILQTAAFTISPLSRLLDLVTPNFNDLAVTLLCVLTPVVIVELTKVFARYGVDRRSQAQA
ncbi:MAG TPA: cation-transporting P-type ATPase [Pyrinomonadaceae bacterium]|nr:cation-transporting P-type ATPase [Acidobacteriota bacterium]HQZ95841.1 cation-transporting P-type ATPase [Pyrinomonadaceae bacterium]